MRKAFRRLLEEELLLYAVGSGENSFAIVVVGINQKEYALHLCINKYYIDLRIIICILRLWQQFDRVYRYRWLRKTRWTILIFDFPPVYGGREELTHFF